MSITDNFRFSSYGKKLETTREEENKRWRQANRKEERHGRLNFALTSAEALLKQLNNVYEVPGAWCKV
jgi:hypothetical protein